MYKIKNKMKDIRKFKDSYSGKNIFVEPGKFVITQKPIKENSVFEVEQLKEQKIKEIKKQSEDD